MPFTPEEKELLEHYVTSAEENIFAVKGMSGMVGAAYARYSRAKGGFREVLLKEFLKEGVIDPKHADQLIERILIAYGDDSVGELEGAHVSFEKISILSTKEIEDRRIGGSPIEQSTRYVLYDQKDEHGRWMYYRGDDMVKASFGVQYVETMDHIFEVYASLVEPLRNYFEAQKPLQEAQYDINGDGVKESWADCIDESTQKAFKQTYTFELRAKACDVLRSLLPLSTLTNVGIFGNGRFYQHTLSHLLTTDYAECHAIAQGAHHALGQIIPQYIRRAARSEYLVRARANMKALARELAVAPSLHGTENEIVLHDEGAHIESIVQRGMSVRDAYTRARDNALLASMLYCHTHASYAQLVAFVDGLSDEYRARLCATYVGERGTRRDRPGRALESGYTYMFDCITTFGTYKDLERHRMNTQIRQVFSPYIGFSFPEELDAIGARKAVETCLDKVRDLYARIETESPELAQYVVLHGHLVRWLVGMNDREAMHLCELRSGAQGHPQYRRAAQIIHRLIGVAYPWRAEAMKFVDHNEYYWSRAESEARQRVKEAQLEKKLGAQQES